MRQISHSIFQSLILRFQVSVSTAIGALNCLEFSYEKFSCEVIVRMKLLVIESGAQPALHFGGVQLAS